MIKPLTGYIDICDRERIAGWAFDPAAPNLPVRLRILMNGQIIDEITADNPRIDLKDHHASGACAFDWCWPHPPPHEGCLIELVDAQHNRPLNNSPFLIPALPSQLNGSIDILDRLHIAGWVQDTLNPDRTVWLTLLINDVPVARLSANQFRSDLREAGLGSGRHGFDHVFSTPLNPLADHDIQLLHGQERFEKPRHLSRSDHLTADVQHHLTTLIQNLHSPQARNDTLAFLTASADHLRAQTGSDIASLTARELAYRARRRHENPAAIAPCVLFIDDRAPDPTRDAGSVALLSHIRTIHSLGYDCLFIPSRHPPSEHDRNRLEHLGITCLMPPVFTGPEEALKRLGTGLEAVYLHRLNNAESYAALTRAFAPTAALVWSVADLASLRLHRQAEVEHRPELHRAASRMEVRENMSAWMADTVLTHSPVETALLQRTVPTATIHTIPWAVPVRSRAATPDSPPVIAFIAHFAHAPNIDAAKWLVLTLFPRLKALIPTVTCRLIGSAMPHAIHMLAEPGLEIIGHTPDLADALSGVSLCVAPLRYGAGIKGKVLEAWSLGLPVMMTPVAAEGLIKDMSAAPWAVAIADNPDDFARKTANLLTPSARKTHLAAARKLLRQNFSDTRIRALLKPVFPVPDEEPLLAPLQEDPVQTALGGTLN